MDLSAEDPTVRDSFNFIRGMRAEQTVLNVQCKLLRKDITEQESALVASVGDYNKVTKLTEILKKSEALCSTLVICENFFRDRMSRRHDVSDMQKLLDKLKRQLLAGINRYDKLLKTARGEMEVAQKEAVAIQ
jgi:hypothetical protein